MDQARPFARPSQIFIKPSGVLRCIFLRKFGDLQGIIHCLLVGIALFFHHYLLPRVFLWDGPNSETAAATLRRAACAASSKGAENSHAHYAHPASAL